MTAAKLTLVPDFAQAAPADQPGQPLAKLAAPGRIVELCGDAQTTAAVTLLAEVQREGETAAWIQLAGGDLYPPDLAAAGVDVDALIVIHTPRSQDVSTPLARLKVSTPLARLKVSTPLARQTVSTPLARLRGGANNAGPHGQCRAAELLLRSGGFGLVILDFGQAEPRGSAAWQGRLLGLARQHEARVVILRERTRGLAHEHGSLGPLTSLRIASWVERSQRADDPPGFRPRTGCFSLRHEVLKNKSGGPLEPASTRLRGPWGFA